MLSLRKTLSYIFVVLLASLSAVNYIIFIFPNSFAPTGLDGICTMIQDVLDINMGYLALLGNIPLLICAYIFLNRSFAAKTRWAAIRTDMKKLGRGTLAWRPLSR